jgi:hypothetical protein
MIKAIISNGVIVPRDPLPADWQEGTEVAVERFPGDAALTKDSSCTDVWMDEVETIARQGNHRMTSGWMPPFWRFTVERRIWHETR